ncbi:SDR family oxidoreductase [Paenibacillus vulneris]|uniref:SDR family NAD(P)-dependent oxidoreductase n=1 Tax=Paenibacillus vulneris TaxID=1133364 RepID=A0ABW3UPU8_9BACL
MSILMKNKAGLVTGAGSGIGRASALAFAREGAKVMVSDYNQELGEETIRLIKLEGGEASFFKCDVSDEEQVKLLIEATVERFGKLDFAHNNAGISSPTVPIGEMKTEDWDRTIKINLYGVFFCIKHEVNAMLKNGGGAIVNTSSGSGIEGNPNMAPYTASKFAINGLTRSVAIEYGKHGIRINSICPGMTRTPLNQTFFENSPEQAEALQAIIPLRRVSEPEEQGNAAVWLCSDMAKYITGVALPVDGGFVAGK